MFNKPKRNLAGQCQCGAIKHSVADKFLYANCHCTDCRRMTGSAFKPFAGIERAKMTVTDGAGNLTIVGDEMNHDARCGTCGSFLYSVVREGAFVHVAMGSLVEAPAILPTEHIYVGSKAPWYTINDDLPQYARHSFEGPPITR